jgi:hypothetical protein
MSTGRKLVSDIRGRYKIINTDNLITDRVIFSEIKNSTFLLLKRETNLRKLWSTDTIFTAIPCLELKEVSISECASYTEPCNIARSVYKLPKIAEGNYQYVIQGVYSVNAMSGKGKKIKETSVNRYINCLNLPLKRKEEYFWISDGYLYVTNPSLKAVRIVALFEEDVSNEILYPECDCGKSPTDEEWCKNPLDKGFSLPGYLEKQVLDLTSETLLRTYFSISADKAQDGVDTQGGLQTK